MRMAVVHPVDGNSLRGVIDAAQAGLVVPVLVGPEAKIRAAAAAEQIDLSPYELVPTRHSHEAAATAVALARAGKVEALMKGSLHTDELMHEVVDQDKGLCTGRRMSHVFAMDVPEYPRPLFITDAAINIYPDLEDKRDIVQNAIDLAHALGSKPPRWRSCLLSRRSTRRYGPRSKRRHLVQNGGSRADHGRSGGRPARFRYCGFGGGGQGQRASSRRWPDGPTSSLSQTSNRATCW